jgi:hypothetical protein
MMCSSADDALSRSIGVYVVWILGMTIQSQITDFVCFTRSLYAPTAMPT